MKNAARQIRTAGDGILRYTGLITITTTTVEDLDGHVAALEQAAIQANCETRLLLSASTLRIYTLKKVYFLRQIQHI